MNAPQIVKWANVSGPPVGPITRIADFVPVLEAHVKKHGIRQGEWIIGYGYDRSNLAEGRELLAAELDPAFPDNPVMLIHIVKGFKIVRCCTLTLEKAGQEGFSMTISIQSSK